MQLTVALVGSGRAFLTNEFEDGFSSVEGFVLFVRRHFCLGAGAVDVRVVKSGGHAALLLPSKDFFPRVVRGETLLLRLCWRGGVHAPVDFEIKVATTASK